MPERSSRDLLRVLQRGDAAVGLGAAWIAFAMGGSALLAFTFASALNASDAIFNLSVRYSVGVGALACGAMGAILARRDDVPWERALAACSIPAVLLAISFFLNRDDLNYIGVPGVIGSAGLLAGYWYGRWRSGRTSAST